MTLPKFVFALVVAVLIWTILVSLALGIPYQTVLGAFVTAISDAWYFVIGGLYGLLLAVQGGV